MTVPIQRLKRPERLCQSVQEAIKNYIVENNLSSGDPLLSENELAKQLGVSRNSVREAIKALEMNGFLEARKGSGVFVGDFSFDILLENLPYGLMQDLRDLKELLDIRLMLEAGSIQFVIQQISDEHIEELRAVLLSMKEKALRGEQLSNDDRAFHQLLFSAVGNNLLIKLLDIFWLAYDRACLHVDISDPDPMKTYQDHVVIFEAIVAKDVEEARDALAHSHITGLYQRLDDSSLEK